MKLLMTVGAALALFASAPAMAAYICGDNVNVRGPLIGGYASVIGSAYYGEHVRRTGESYYANVDGRYRRFVRVYFYEYPQGYGYVASQYVCGY